MPIMERMRNEPEGEHGKHTKWEVGMGKEQKVLVVATLASKYTFFHIPVEYIAHIPVGYTPCM